MSNFIVCTVQLSFSSCNWEVYIVRLREDRNDFTILTGERIGKGLFGSLDLGDLEDVKIESLHKNECGIEVPDFIRNLVVITIIILFYNSEIINHTSNTGHP